MPPCNAGPSDNETPRNIYSLYKPRLNVNVYGGAGSAGAAATASAGAASSALANVLLNKNGAAHNAASTWRFNNQLFVFISIP